MHDDGTALEIDLTDDEKRWPYAEWKLFVERLLEIGDGLRMGLVRVQPDGTAQVQVFSPAAQREAELATLRLGERVPCKSRTVRMVEVDPDAARPWVRVVVS